MKSIQPYKDIFREYLKLCKIKISLFAVFSSVTGFLLASSQLEEKMVVLITGVFCLACGSCALNQYQERDIDALMSRTKNRPVPAEKIKPLYALSFSIMLIFFGLFVLFSGGGLIASVLGLFAVIWYNGVYTYFKRKTAFALIPGALIGAIPPAIGWVMGGGNFLDFRLFALCFFFFMWQVPHFWLLLLNYGEEYEKAGLPSLTRVFTRTQLVRIIFHWIFATALSCLFIALYGNATSFLKISLLASSFWLVWNGIRILKGNEFHYGLAFNRINVYMFIVLSLITVERIVFFFNEKLFTNAFAEGCKMFRTSLF